MTREEAIEFIVQSVKSDVDMAKVADAIKALEQDSVLNKIRAEIIELRRKQNLGVSKCLNIIDEYRVEREVEE